LSESTPLKAALPASRDRAAHGGGGDVIPPPLQTWVQVFDVTSGRDYYYNKAEGKTAWSPPPGARVVSTAAAEPGATPSPLKQLLVVSPRSKAQLHVSRSGSIDLRGSRRDVSDALRTALGERPVSDGGVQAPLVELLRSPSGEAELRLMMRNALAERRTGVRSTSPVGNGRAASARRALEEVLARVEGQQEGVLARSLGEGEARSLSGAALRPTPRPGAPLTASWTQMNPSAQTASRARKPLHVASNAWRPRSADDSHTGDDMLALMLARTIEQDAAAVDVAVAAYQRGTPSPARRTLSPRHISPPRESPPRESPPREYYHAAPVAAPMHSSMATTYAGPSLRRPFAAVRRSDDAYARGYDDGVDRALGRLGSVLTVQYDVPPPVASLVAESRRAWIENHAV
jgi:hypothetical protein